MIKKGDIVVFITVIALAVVFTVMLFFNNDSAKTVTVTLDNKIIGEYPLNRDTVIELEHNTVKIENGYCFMEHADCKNQICVKQKKINRKGESIICLPNRVIVIAK